MSSCEIGRRHSKPTKWYTVAVGVIFSRSSRLKNEQNIFPIQTVQGTKTKLNSNRNVRLFRFDRFRRTRLNKLYFAFSPPQWFTVDEISMFNMARRT